MTNWLFSEMFDADPPESGTALSKSPRVPDVAFDNPLYAFQPASTQADGLVARLMREALTAELTGQQTAESDRPYRAVPRTGQQNPAMRKRLKRFQHEWNIKRAIKDAGEALGCPDPQGEIAEAWDAVSKSMLGCLEDLIETASREQESAWL
jgi:hypothetical protein